MLLICSGEEHMLLTCCLSLSCCRQQPTATTATTTATITTSTTTTATTTTDWSSLVILAPSLRAVFVARVCNCPVEVATLSLLIGNTSFLVGNPPSFLHCHYDGTITEQLSSTITSMSTSPHHTRPSHNCSSTLCCSSSVEATGRCMYIHFFFTSLLGYGSLTNTFFYNGNSSTFIFFLHDRLFVLSPSFHTARPF
eukprot:GHVS01004061.1.p1 GENE.GHVS01004061.1~~GHVS01004061.1.p1  ORF type:complete len:196 (+),score=41.73 GHVS01004061.1:631-1218(+)